MSSSSDLGTILLVESDIGLGEVLSRVLGRRGLEVVHATSAAQALRLAKQHRPRLALVDFGSRDGKGPEVIEELRAHHPDLQMIVLTDETQVEAQAIPAVGSFGRYLTKPINLPDLRQAVESALTTIVNAESKNTATGNVQSRYRTPHFALRVPWIAFVKELVMRVVPVRVFKVAGVIVVVLIVMTGIGILLGGVPTPWQAAAAERPTTPPRKAEKLAVKLVPGKPHTLAVPEDARKALGISTPKGDFIAVAKEPAKTKALVMPGTTMLDPTRLYRIRAPFAPSPSSAECIEIGPVRDETSPVSKDREIRSGDRVHKGQFLAAFHSVDVGNKKNDLIDAMYQMYLDQQILNKAEEHADAVPLVFLWNARRQLAGDQNNVNRALATLRSWRISEEDIKKVQKEAQEVINRGGNHDPGVDARWPRVELKAPDDGVIVERNLALHEVVVDNTTNLFQIARVDRLAVVANCPEDDLPVLEKQKLTTAQLSWTVKTVGSPPLPGHIDDISYIIDPNQHTAVVKGHIDNPKEILRAGQFISATVELDAPKGIVEVPVDSVSEDGQQAVVFVQTDPKNHPEHFTMRRVQLEARFENTVFVRSKPFAESEQPTKQEQQEGIFPKEPLVKGDLILRTGVGELKAKLLDLESQPEKK